MTYRGRLVLDYLRRHDRSAPESHFFNPCSWQERAGELKTVDFSHDPWFKWALVSVLSSSMGVVGFVFAPGSASRVASALLLLVAIVFIAGGVKALDWRINRRKADASRRSS